MSLDKYFEVIESLEFQVQFSILSGFRSVRESMSEDPILKSLILNMVENSQTSIAVFERIEHILRKVETGADMPYDESVAAYLYSLSRVDLAIAVEASDRILSTGGLWWSVQLALYVKDFVKQVTDSIHISSTLSEPTAYAMSDRIHHSIRQTFLMILKSEAFEIRAVLKDRQLSLLQLRCEVSPETDDNEASEPNTTLSYSIAPARKVSLSPVD